MDCEKSRRYLEYLTKTLADIKQFTGGCQDSKEKPKKKAKRNRVRIPAPLPRFEQFEVLELIISRYILGVLALRHVGKREINTWHAKWASKQFRLTWDGIGKQPHLYECIFSN